MSDEKQFELADQLAEADRAGALAKNAQKVAPETHEDFDGEHCLKCGEDIPVERLALKKIHCVGCQTVLENRGKFFRSGK